MAISIETLLRPVSETTPLGLSFRSSGEYDTLRALTSVAGEVNWPRVHETALSAANSLRDLRVWVWIARAGLAVEGLRGLADGLTLIARGLAQYWTTLPPLDEAAREPRARFLGRISALGTLGMTSYLANMDTIMKGGTTIISLSSDLDRAIVRARDSKDLFDVVKECRAALESIATTFREAYGARDDPQIGFEILTAKLAPLELRLSTAVAETAARNGSANGHNGVAPAGAAYVPIVIRSRDDVEQVLDLVLDFYRVHEPASPVPLLVGRARRLVRMNFIDALKDLAPAGMKELQVVAGLTGDER